MTPDTEPEKPKRSRRLRKKAVDASEVADATPDVAADEAVAPDDSGVGPQAMEEQEPVAPAEPLEVPAEPPVGDDDKPDAEDEAPVAEKAKPARRGRRKAEPAAVEPPPKPAPSRRRARRDPNAPIPVVRAQAKYVRSSARKARLVCDHIRGRSVEDARAILAHTPRAIARDWSKLLESAVANAEHNHELVGEDLYVKAVHADEGPTIKRFRPRAMGRATQIRKRTSHLTILLTPKE
jgi:ribosomal protein L22